MIPQKCTTNEYPQHMFSWRNKKKNHYHSVKIALSGTMTDLTFLEKSAYEKICMKCQTLFSVENIAIFFFSTELFTNIECVKYYDIKFVKIE